MNNKSSWLKKGLFIGALIGAGVGSVALYWHNTHQVDEKDYYVYEFNDSERDIKDIDATFQDDLYWLSTRKNYDVASMLLRRSSNYADPTLNNDMFIYVMRDKATDAYIGFTSFFRLSFYKGQILFVSVNKAFRGKKYGQ